MTKPITNARLDREDADRRSLGNQYCCSVEVYDAIRERLRLAEAALEHSGNRAAWEKYRAATRGEVKGE